MSNPGSRRLIFTGWGLYAGALVCPALGMGTEPLWGWQCLLMSFFGCPPYYAAFNLLFAGSFLVYHWEGGLEREAYGVFLLVGWLASMVFVLLKFDVRLGAYLWSASFFTAGVGFFLSGPTIIKVRRE